MNSEHPVLNSLLRNAILGLALVIAGGLIGRGLVHFRQADRFVTVKGVAEREVSADLALWPMRFVTSGDSLPQTQAQLQRDADAVVKFLTAAGVSSAEIAVQSVEVTDKAAQAYGPDQFQNRFVLSQTIMVRTQAVQKVDLAAQQLHQLVAAGVVLNGDFGGTGPLFLYTKLNEVKPAMIAEATANARTAAEQFAADSGAPLGGIRQASQGLFQIQGRDQVPQLSADRQVMKTVRVVTTVDYYLD